MKRYPSYQPTGIPWLPEAPATWEVKKVHQFVLEGKVKNKGLQETNVLSLSYGKVIRKQNLYAGLKPADYSTYQIVDNGQVVLRLTDLQNDHKSLRCGLAKERGIITSAYVTLVVKEVSSLIPEYLYRILHVYDILKVFYSMGDGLRQTMNFDDVSRLEILLPPLETQERIVAFLDAQCGKIDKLVAAKAEKIKLLKEYRERLIADAVTRGIPGKNTAFKSTTISWLPEVPEGWEVKRAKCLFKKEQRPIRPEDEIVTAFRDGEVTLRKNRRTTGFTEATDYTHYQGIRKGDLVIHQMDAFAGCAGVSDSDGMGTPVLSVCTPIADFANVFYFAHVIRLMGHNGYIQSLARGIRERSSDFRFDTFSKQHLPFPPLEEQKQIVEYIEAKTQQIDALVGKLDEEIVRLKEYRERLIADVVTGQQMVE